MITSNRIVKLDMARTFAILCVVLCHCSEMIYTQQSVKVAELGISSRIFMFGTFTIGRLGVPIFLYLSGILLLKKTIDSDEDIFKFYKNNLFPLFVVNEIWVILYKLYGVFVLNEKFIFGDLIRELLLLKNSTMVNMWYMPMIIGLYIGIPLLAKIVKSFSFKVICPIMLAIFIFEYIEPMLNVFVRIFNFKETFYSDMNIPYMGAAYGLHLLIGYYIYNNKLRIKKELLIFLFLANYIIILCIQLYSLSSESHYAYKVWYDSPFLLICTACLFALFTRIDDNVINERMSNIFTYISRISMGIYFVHIIVIMTKIKYMGQIFASLSLETAFLTIITIVLSAVIVGVLSRNKYVARYIFLIKH